MRKRIVIGGASGFVGTALQNELNKSDWEIIRLTRSEPRPGEAQWHPDAYDIDPQNLAGAHAVVCLNGAPLARWPWTHAYKHEMVNSRLKSVKTLADAINALPESERPETFLTGSAVGYYGSRDNEVLEENSAPANDFLGGLCQVWERESRQAKVTRVVNIRTGLVLEDGGGILHALEPLFKTFLGGRLGDGRQWMPTISLRDHVRAMRFLLDNPQLEGAFNLTGPNPCTNEEFTVAVATHYRRIPGPPVPASVLRMVLGDMSVLATSSQYAVPTKLFEAGFIFKDETLQQQLKSATSNR